MSCVLILLMVIDVVIVVLFPWGCLYPSFYIQGGDVTRKVIESITT
jgi:NADH:ubiquinone oxidoreductase subunit 3 (subunit A)